MADVNGDGRADAVAIGDSETWVMLSNGSSFGPPTMWSANLFYGTHATTMADVNGDGRADAVAIGDSETWVMLALH
jgi:hypothetical protein